MSKIIAKSTINESRYYSLYKTMLEGACLHEIIYEGNKAVNYRILDVNPAYEQLIGIRRADVVGKKATEAYGVDKAPYLNVYAGVAASGKPVSFKTYHAPTGKHLNVSVSSPEKGKVNVLFIDITEQEKAETKVKKLYSLQSVIKNVNQSLLIFKDEMELFQFVCNELSGLEYITFAWIGLSQPRTHDIKPVAWSGYEAGYLSSIKVTWDDSKFGLGPTGMAIKSGQPYIIDDLEEDPRFEPWRDEALKRGYASRISLPLANRGQVIGALNVYSGTKHAFTEKEIEFLREVSDDISIGIRTSRLQKELHQSEEEYRVLIDNASECIVVAQDGFLKFVNPRTLELTGYSMEELKGRPYLDFFHPDDRLKVADTTAKLSEKGASFDCFRFIRKDGNTIWLQSNAVQILWEGKPAILVLATDVTEVKESEQLLRKSELKYSTLVEKSNDGLIVIQDGRIKFTNTKMSEITGFQVAEAHGQSFIDFVAPSFRGQVMNFYRKRMAGEPVPNKYEIEITSKDGKTIPVEVSPSIIDYEGRPADMAIVSDITERKQRQEELDQSFRKLRGALEATVDALSSVAEVRDPYTAGHQRHVASLAVAIAHEMGLSEDQCEGIRIAAVLHDIGKISIPAEILTKPEKLSDTEMSLMKTHPQVGCDLIKRIEFPWPVSTFVHQHHERLNGSGYPQGLAGPDTTLEAKILAVSDVVEAMSSHRPYRPAVGVGKALEEISQNKGTLYDGAVVDACLQLYYEKGFKLEGS